MNGVTSAMLASSMMPTRNMKTSAIEKFQSLKMRTLMNGRADVRQSARKK